jgi:YjbE family integral membrane protein
MVDGRATRTDRGARSGARKFVASSLVGALAEVLLVNLVLSGDNAVVIGLAAKDLSSRARRRAILLGGGLAVGLRLILTLPAEFLLHVPLVRAGGGLLLGWVAYRLLTETPEETAQNEASSIIDAVRLIVIADATMSLDNILAVAAVAERSAHAVLVLVVGLAISIPIVLLGGDIVARLMRRVPILAWAGGAVLAYTAGQLVAEDESLGGVFGVASHAGLVFATAVAVVLVSLAVLRVRGRAPSAQTRSEAPAAAQERTASAGRPAAEG